MSAGIHERPTRIVRAHVARNERKTAVNEDQARTLVVQRTSCASCATSLDVDASFCGMCGDRLRPRSTLVGEVLDGLYRIEARIAEGKTTSIYRARYLPGDDVLVLKVLHPELAMDPVAVDRFHREARCLARLRGAHVVVSHDRGVTEDGVHYIALELLSGERLDVRRRARGTLAWRTVLPIVRGICAALAEAHASGIVHRELSPRNVMLEAGDHVKVLDFGSAKLRVVDSDDDLALAGRAVGMLEYSAPEQLAGQACDARADVYAIGAITIELLTGARGLAGRLPADAPSGVERLLARCLAVDPAARFASATELAAELDRIVAPAASREHRVMFAGTPAFALQPPRIPLDVSDDLLPLPARRTGLSVWAVATAVGVLAISSVVAGCF